MSIGKIKAGRFTVTDKDIKDTGSFDVLRNVRLEKWLCNEAGFIDCVFTGTLRSINFNRELDKEARAQLGRKENTYTGNDFSGATLEWVAFKGGVDLTASGCPLASSTCNCPRRIESSPRPSSRSITFGRLREVLIAAKVNLEQPAGSSSGTKRPNLAIDRRDRARGRAVSGPGCAGGSGPRRPVASPAVPDRQCVAARGDRTSFDRGSHGSARWLSLEGSGCRLAGTGHCDQGQPRRGAGGSTGTGRGAVGES